MNTYNAFYKNKQTPVLADTTYDAQQLAATKLKAKKTYDVTVMLVELDGEQYTHSPASL